MFEAQALGAHVHGVPSQTMLLNMSIYFERSSSDLRDGAPCEQFRTKDLTNFHSAPSLRSDDGKTQADL